MIKRAIPDAFYNFVFMISQCVIVILHSIASLCAEHDKQLNVEIQSSLPPDEAHEIHPVQHRFLRLVKNGVPTKVLAAVVILIAVALLISKCLRSLKRRNLGRRLATGGHEVERCLAAAWDNDGSVDIITHSILIFRGQSPDNAEALNTLEHDIGVRMDTKNRIYHSVARKHLGKPYFEDTDEDDMVTLHRWRERLYNTQVLPNLCGSAEALVLLGIDALYEQARLTSQKDIDLSDLTTLLNEMRDGHATVLRVTDYFHNLRVASQRRAGDLSGDDRRLLTQGPILLPHLWNAYNTVRARMHAVKLALDEMGLDDAELLRRIHRP